MKDDTFPSPRILFYDLETAPALAAIWSTGKQYVGGHQLRRRVRVQCVAWMFRGSEPEFAAEWQPGGRKRMLRRIRAAFDEADLVVGFNNDGFDDRHMRREFLEAGLKPPSPYASIDLYKASKKAFNFDSHRLGFLVEELHLGSKRKESMDLWDALDRGDAQARAEMEKYNLQDVQITAALYERLLPWISGHPHVGLYADDSRPRCPACGSARMERRGTYRSATSAYQRFSCQVCGKWARSARRDSTTPLRGVS